MSSIGRTVIGWSRHICSVVIVVAAATSAPVVATSVAGTSSSCLVVVWGFVVHGATRKHSKLVLPGTLAPTVVVAGVGHGGVVASYSTVGDSIDLSTPACL